LTHAIILMKGIPNKREELFDILNKTKSNEEFQKQNNIEIIEIFMSFGWSDFIILLKSNNVELIKISINELCKKTNINGNNVATSTIICSTLGEFLEKQKEWRGRLT